jgi:hypothetical protein
MQEVFAAIVTGWLQDYNTIKVQFAVTVRLGGATCICPNLGVASRSLKRFS